MTHASPELIRLGRKTATRRVIRPEWWRCLDPDDPEDLAKAVLQCPYGVAGDHLWVKESWGLWDTDPKDGPKNATIFYKAKDGGRRGLRHQRWRSPYFMPRWASRFLLEIAQVRIETLQNITEEGAKAEGIEQPVCPHPDCSPGSCASSRYRPEFALRWNEINSKRGFGWETDPWVFAIDYKVIEGLAPGASHSV